MSNKIEDQIPDQNANHGEGEHFTYVPAEEPSDIDMSEASAASDEALEATDSGEPQSEVAAKITGKEKLLALKHKAQLLFSNTLGSEKIKGAVNGIKNKGAALKTKIAAKGGKKSLYILLGSGAAVVLVLGALHLFESGTANKEKIEAARMQQQGIDNAQNQQVTVLQQKLSKLEHQLKHQKTTEDKLSQLQNEVGQLTQAVQGAQDSANQAKSAAQQSATALENSAKVGQQQVATVEKQIAEIHQQLSPKGYLPVTDLPFEIVGSGYWGSDLMVTIAIKDIYGGYHYRLMGVGQQFDCTSFQWQLPSCANWTLKSISGDPASAVFVNGNDATKKVKAEL